ncbi:hypothetical protein OOO55_004490 [Salmonella enterica]|nr:hypothetical protein [Salmonella enterica]
MDKVFYCKKWSVGYKEPMNPLSENEAKKKHSRGMPYTALIGSDVKPSHVIQVTKNAGWISVGFLDEELREYLLYSFKVLDDERLFLSMAVHREFAEIEGEGAGFMNVSNGTTYLFKEDGHTVIREEHFNPYLLDESETKVDVSGNYETFPAFGNYQSILRKER